MLLLETRSRPTVLLSR